MSASQLIRVQLDTQKPVSANQVSNAFWQNLIGKKLRCRFVLGSCGETIVGFVTGFDWFNVVVNRDGKTILIPKHSILFAVQHDTEVPPLPEGGETTPCSHS